MFARGSCMVLAVSSGALFAAACGGTKAHVAQNPNPVSCDPPCKVLVSDQPQAYRIAVDAASVYWTAGPDQGGVWRAGLDGGNPTELASVDSPMGIAIDDAFVYWAERGSGGPGNLSRAPLGGGDGASLSTAGTPDSIAIDATNVYWVERADMGFFSTLNAVPIAGGASKRLASGSQLGNGIAVDSTSVYWTDGGSRGYSDVPGVGTATDGTVMKVSLAGGTPTIIASAQHDPHGIAVDSTSVYWVNAGDGTVMKAPLAGDATPVTLASGQSAPMSIAVDANAVYWTTQGTYSAQDSSGASYANDDGTVMKVPLDGGKATTLASGQRLPEGIAVDDTSVYWTTANYDAAVLKAPK